MCENPFVKEIMLLLLHTILSGVILKTKWYIATTFIDITSIHKPAYHYVTVMINTYFILKSICIDIAFVQKKLAIMKKYVRKPKSRYNNNIQKLLLTL